MRGQRCARWRKMQLHPPGFRRAQAARHIMKWTEELQLSSGEKQDGRLRGPRTYPHPYLEIPEGITAIEADVFRGNGHLQIVQLPDSLQQIGDRAFAGCSNLTTIIGGSHLRQIGNEAFSGCSQLQQVPLPASLRQIGDRAFASCCSLRDAMIPGTVEKLGQQPFYRCGHFHNSCVPQHLAGTASPAERLGFADEDGFIIKDGELQQYCGPEGVRSVRVPETVTVVRAGAFDGRAAAAGGLSIHLPAGIRTIGRSAVFVHSNVRVNLPEGYLQQPRPLPSVATVELLEHSWKNEYLAADIASLYLFQDSVLLSKAACLLEERDPEQMVKLMRRRLGDSRLTPVRRRRGAARMAEFCFAHAGRLPENWPRHYFPPEQRPEDLVFEANSLDPQAAGFTHIRAKDGVGQADPHLVKTALAAYLAVGAHCERLGADPFLIPLAEQAAAALDKESLAAALPELLPGAAAGKTVQLYPFLRFASGQQAESFLSALVPPEPVRSGRRGARQQRPDFGRLRPALLSAAGEVLVQVVRADAAQPDVHLLRTYLRILSAQEMPGALCFPPSLGLGADGRKTYLDAVGNPLLELFFEGGAFLMRDPRTNRRRRTVPAMPDAVEQRVQITQDIVRIQDYYAALTHWIEREQLDSFLLGAGLEPAVWHQIYQDPFLRQQGSSIIWEQGGRQFVWDGAYPRTDRGRRLRLQTDELICVAHPLDMTEQQRTRWKRWLARRPARAGFDQLAEPVYSLDELTPDRYAGCYIESWDLQKAEPQLAFEQTLRRRHNALAIGAHGALEAAAPVSARGSARLMLGELSISGLDRCANHALYLLDLWTAQQRAARDDISILKVLKTLPSEALAPFLETAVRHGAAQLTAALLEYMNMHPQKGQEEEFSLDG